MILNEIKTYASNSWMLPLNPKIRAGFRHAPHGDQAIYSNSKAVLLISPLQVYYNDKERFAALIDLMNRVQFKEILVIIGDTNNQYNLIALGQSKSAAFSIAKLQGDRWFYEYAHLLSGLKVNYSISRWEHWLSLPEYTEHRLRVDDRYVYDQAFKSEFLRSAYEYLARQNNAGNISTQVIEKQLHYSLEYLKEECTIIMPMWAALGINFVIYPTGMLAAMQKTFEIFVKPYYSNFRVHWLSLRFKRLKNEIFQ